MKYAVFYMQPEWFRQGILGRRPNFENLSATHNFLKETMADSLMKLFEFMQAECWSPNGEARSLIEEKGLSHTSMSVGDVAIDENGVCHLVDSHGFRVIGRVHPKETSIIVKKCSSIT